MARGNKAGVICSGPRLRAAPPGTPLRSVPEQILSPSLPSSRPPLLPRPNQTEFAKRMLHEPPHLQALACVRP